MTGQITALGAIALLTIGCGFAAFLCWVSDTLARRSINDAREHLACSPDSEKAGDWQWPTR